MLTCSADVIICRCVLLKLLHDGFLGRFPGENGVVAPGLSCQYPIRFAPESLADYDDSIKVQ